MCYNIYVSHSDLHFHIKIGNNMKPLECYKQGSVWRVNNGEFRFMGDGKMATSQSGYGMKIKTDYKVEISMKNKSGFIYNKLYRVYSCQYSNCATLYVVVGGRNYVLDNTYR